jgi:hypothetical protein
VVNITKFGAFVNILPGRDGLVHISKLGRGKRIAQVEDVVQLGDQIEVVVEDIDDKGKVSLAPAGEGPAPSNGEHAPAAPSTAPTAVRAGDRWQVPWPSASRTPSKTRSAPSWAISARRALPSRVSGVAAAEAAAVIADQARPPHMNGPR